MKIHLLFIIILITLSQQIFSVQVYFNYNYLFIQTDRREQMNTHYNSKEHVYQQEQQEQNQKQEQTYAKDYISLKNKTYKSKLDNQESLLTYYTSEKYNEYFTELSSQKAKVSNISVKQFKEMVEMAQIGRNICVFGYGSKIQILNDLYNTSLTEYHCFDIKAYIPTVTQKKIYNHFGGFLIDIGLIQKVQAIGIKDQIEFYRQVLAHHSDKRIIIKLHSLDGINLMSPEVQERMAELLEMPQIQIICSIDNMQAVFNLSPTSLQKYKFLFFNINTRLPYIQELRFRPLRNENKESTQESLMYVWQSLNKNQKYITKFIAMKELKNLGHPQQEASHYTLSELLQLCIEEIVLSSDHQLRQNLLELLDHKVIIQRNDEKKNKKIYLMKYEKRTLERLLDLKIE